MDTVEDRIAAVLRAEPGLRMCDGCLALEVKATLAEAQAGFAALDGDVSFEVAQGGCTRCRRSKIVVCAVRDAGAG